MLGLLEPLQQLSWGNRTKNRLGRLSKLFSYALDICHLVHQLPLQEQPPLSFLGQSVVEWLAHFDSVGATKRHTTRRTDHMLTRVLFYFCHFLLPLPFTCTHPSSSACTLAPVGVRVVVVVVVGTGSSTVIGSGSGSTFGSSTGGHCEGFWEELQKEGKSHSNLAPKEFVFFSFLQVEFQQTIQCVIIPFFALIVEVYQHLSNLQVIREKKKQFLHFLQNNHQCQCSSPSLNTESKNLTRGLCPLCFLWLVDKYRLQ